MSDNPRCVVVDGSQSRHCCFDATVVDTSKPTGYMGQFDAVCECFTVEDARVVCDALNLANQNNA